MANVNIRVDDSVKKNAEAIFSELGLSMSTATNIFYRHVIRTGGVPFELKLDPFWSEANLAHLVRAAADMDAGRNVSEHELLEADG